MPLICSRANNRNSYIQSWTSVRPSACVASTVTRLIRSLGNAGHRPVVIRRTAFGFDGFTSNVPSLHAALDVHPLENRGDDFDVFFPRAVDRNLAAGDRRDHRPAPGLDVVAAEPMLRAVQSRHAFDAQLRAADAR